MNKIIQWVKRVFSLKMTPEQIEYAQNELKFLFGINEKASRNGGAKKGIVTRLKHYFEEKRVLREIKQKTKVIPEFTFDFELYKKNNLVAVLLWFCDGELQINFQKRDTGESLFHVEGSSRDIQDDSFLLSFEKKMALDVLNHSKIFFQEDLEDADNWREETLNE